MICPEEEVLYGYTCEKMSIPHSFFNTFDEALRAARFEQSKYRPYYIVELTKHYEIVGKVAE